MNKIVLIGSNHAGTAVTNTVLDNYKDCEFVIFEANDNLSYLSCGTALYVGRQIKETGDLFYSSKEILQGKGAKIYMNTLVTDIDFGAKTVTAKRGDGTEIKETYDKLVLATGSRPILPNIPGINLHGVHTVKFYQDNVRIDDDLDDPHVKNVATVGAGYIGIEIAEAIKRRGKNSLLFEMQECCLCGYYDRIMTSEMDEVLRKNGIELHYSEILKEIKTSSGNRVTSIVTDKGEYDVQMVLMSIGFAPRTELVQGKLETLKNGAIVVNTNQETSLKDVFAVGDCATVLNNSTGKTDYIALATNAIRSGIVAGHNVMGNKMESLGVQGSNGIGIFGYKMFSTGMTLDRANANGYDAACVDHEDLQKFAFMEPPNDKVKIRIVYDTKTRRVLGAQLASYMDVSLALHMFSLAVAKGVTIDELKLLDIFFMPHFNQVMNYITAASIKA